jgi:inositol phosphorylceramide mannosyltransferase catalytic subunit
MNNDLYKLKYMKYKAKYLNMKGGNKSLIENINFVENQQAIKKSHKKTKIPLNIWQTHESVFLTNNTIKKINIIKKNNPEFNYYFHDNKQRRLYLENNPEFDSRVLEAYDKIKPGAGKADIWRLAVILKEGGIYIDVDKILINNGKPFIDIISENDELIHGRGWHIWGNDAPSVNSTICARANHPVIEMAFNSVIDSILNDKPIKNIGKHSGWMELENYTGTPHLWKALSHYTGNINMKEELYQHGIRITQDIENQLEQNENYEKELKELKTTHWMSQSVFNENK